MKKDIIISNTSQFVSRLVKINDSIQESSKFSKPRLLFRGQSDKNYRLLPAIARDRYTVCDISILNEERNLIASIKYKYPAIFKNDLSPVELLSILQHYGIPTRLLDVTENPLVALYFACCSNFEKDGQVYAFCSDEKWCDTMPIQNAIADSFRFADTTFVSLDTFYNDVIEQPYFIEQKPMLNRINDLASYGGANWIKECCDNLIFTQTSEILTRQKQQQGRYILFPNKITQKEDGYYFEKIIEPIPDDSKYIKKIINIKKEDKKKILGELDLLGVNRKVLFADNIDIVCEELVKEANNRVHLN